MRSLFLLLGIALQCSLPLLAQQNQGEVLFDPRYRHDLELQQVGTAIMHVDYAMNADTIGKLSTYIDLQRLEVGKDCAKYSSLFLQKRVAESKAKQTASVIPRVNTGGKNFSYWNEIQYTDLFFKEGKVTEYATPPIWCKRYNAQFTEDCPPQEWQLHPEQQEVLGHLCQRATCHWRGRDFEAWFAPDIPVRRGPWRFNGLPGLILKVYDVDHFYTFEAVSVKNSTDPIMLYDFKYNETTRKKLRAFQYACQHNFSKVVDMEPRKPDVPFDPLEKE